MKETQSLDDFLDIAETGILIDVRTPAEYEAGHIAQAINLPLFSNEERAVVGTLYIRSGSDKAVEKGLEFVGHKMAGWVREARKLANGRTICLYCWRGGMRSNSMAWLFRTAGLQAITLCGGYKAYRRGLAECLNRNPWRFIILGGHTGCGKTEVLDQLKQCGQQVIDLEGLAGHRGSAFGALGQSGQPTTEQFGNRIHEVLRTFDPSRPVWCEDESLSIGRVYIPNEFFAAMSQAPLIIYDIPLSLRLERLTSEYGQYPDEKLIAAFLKIEKRLGGLQTQQAIEYIKDNRKSEAAAIALRYYDKGYDHCKLRKSRTQALNLNTDRDDPRQAVTELLRLSTQLTDETIQI